MARVTPKEEPTRNRIVGGGFVVDFGFVPFLAFCLHYLPTPIYYTQKITAAHYHHPPSSHPPSPLWPGACPGSPPTATPASPAAPCAAPNSSGPTRTTDLSSPPRAGWPAPSCARLPRWPPRWPPYRHRPPPHHPHPPSWPAPPPTPSPLPPPLTPSPLPPPPALALAAAGPAARRARPPSPRSPWPGASGGPTGR